MVLRGLRDLDMVRRLMNSAKGAIEATRVKEEAAKHGLHMAMSLYGVLTQIDDGQSQYRRIEVLSDKNLSAKDTELLYRWFNKVHPIKTYSIWVYLPDSEALTQVFSTW